MDRLTRLNPSTLPATEELGYSQITISNPGRLAFVSGQVAVPGNGEPIPGDLAGQTDRVIGNLAKALEALDASPLDIVQLRIFVVDITPAVVGAVMEKVGHFLAGAKPSLTGVGVPGLASPEFLIEIEMVVQMASD